MKTSKNQISSRSEKKLQLILAVVLVVALCAIGAVVWWIYENTSVGQPELPVVEQSQSSPLEVEATLDEIVTDETATFNSEAIQQAIDSWMLSLSGDDIASVAVMNENGNLIASVEPEKVFFAASIYKLYVAYEGYRQVDRGEVDSNEQYVNGRTRSECLDLMIRESDSPCAEKLWLEIGKSELTAILKSYGINNTSMSDIRTTARDSALMLQRISSGRELTTESQKAFLASMKSQIFRNSLNKGFSDKVTIYNKVGFNELLEYHDVAIVEFEDGRRAIVSVLTSGVGTIKIAKLGEVLEIAMLK